VISGGDWAEDRILPDLVRAAVSGAELVLRSPGSIRPWQYVLEPLGGYLVLAERLVQFGQDYAEAWNFGPHQSGAVTVQALVELAVKYWAGQIDWRIDTGSNPRESRTLKLDCSKAELLGWRPRLAVAEAVRWTMEWYRGWYDGGDMHTMSMRQIDQFSERLRDAD